MRLETVFRVSVYLTLALASIGLAFTEEPYLPGIVYFLAFFLVLLAVAFVMEGRWELTLKASNVLGLLIAAASGLWIAASLVVPSNPWVDSAPYPVALLPFGGPVLMLVLLAKLFRPKQKADYWWLHLIGLMEVALGCILANELAFSFWLFAYLTCGLWSLTLFGLYRDQPQDRAVNPRASAAPLPGRTWGVGWTLGRAEAVIGLGLILFLLTPRFGNQNWDPLHPTPSRGRLETGYSPTMDLNATGEVKVSEEEAFQVKVEKGDGQPKRDLSPQQRWRGTTLELYENGRWGARRRPMFGGWGRRTVYVPIPEGGREDLPPLGPDAFFVTFNLDYQRARGLVLAEPVSPPRAGNLPVRALTHYERWAPVFRERDNCLGAPPDRYAQTYQYVQVVPGWQPPPPAGPLTPDDQGRLLHQPVPGIARWTGELLQRLVARHQLAEADVTFVPDPAFGDGEYLLPQNRAKVARALANYFVQSGEFAYRLEIQRVDKTLDPIEDFLRNTRAGFCEHYATALVLMLRSVGIPARLVLGYRGSEPQGDPPGAEGVYVIRQSDAHSWVEALLPRPAVEGGLEMSWQTLDPTPAQDAPARTTVPWTRWWRNAQLKVREFWKNLIVDYNGERQQDVLEMLGESLGFPRAWDGMEALGAWFQQEVLTGRLLGRRWPWIALPPLFGFGWWAFRRRRTSSPQTATPPPSGDVAFYRHWLALASRYCGLERRPAQTPWEFGAAVQQALARLPGAATVAEVSRRVVDLYYRVRFGNRPLTPSEQAAIEREVAALEPHFAASSDGASPLPSRR